MDHRLSNPVLRDYAGLVLSQVTTRLTCRPDPTKIAYDPFQHQGLPPDLRDHPVRWLDVDQYLVTTCTADDPECFGVLKSAYRDGLCEVEAREIHLRTLDHPEANGRIPQAGEQQWQFSFKLEQGVRLILLMGRESRDRFREFLLSEDLDDAAEAAARAL